jgi:hypothetical protein
MGGTQRVRNFTLHLKEVLDFPDAPVPIPYVDLLTCSIPTYHRGKASRHARENLASATMGVLPSRPSGSYPGKEEFKLSSVSSDDAVSELPGALEAVDLAVDQVRTGHFFVLLPTKKHAFFSAPPPAHWCLCSPPSSLHKGLTCSMTLLLQEHMWLQGNSANLTACTAMSWMRSLHDRIDSTTVDACALVRCL